MSRTSPIIAVRFRDIETDAAVQMVIWQEAESRFAVQYRKQPDATSPGARWKPRAILEPRFWPGDRGDGAKGATVGTLQGWISQALGASAGQTEIQGIWTVEFSQEDHDALDSGAAQPNGLFTKISQRFKTDAPRSVVVDDLRAAALWLAEGPMVALADGDDLSKWTEPALGSAPVAAPSLAEGEEDGILLSDGKTRFLPRVLRGGLTDVTLLRQARENGLIVLLLGPPGTGKSAAVEAAFHEDYARAGLDFNQDALVVGTEDTTTTDLIGGMAQGDDGVFRFKPGKIIKCAQAGVPAFIDEVTLIDPRVMSVVYSLIDGRGILPLPEEYKFTDEVSGLENAVKAQPGFYLVFAGNPNVPGAVISEALKSRSPLRPEYLTDWDTVARLLGPAHEEIVTVCRNMETKRQEGEVVESPQMREMLAYAKTASVFGTEMALSNLLTFFDSDSDREVFLDVLARTMHVGNLQPLRI